MKSSTIKWSVALPIMLFIVYWITGFATALFPKQTQRINFFAKQPAWTFFAPPPTNNYRLHYIVRNKYTKDSITDIEILQPLTQQKRNNAPFNQAAYLQVKIIAQAIRRIHNKVIKEKIQPDTATALALIANSKDINLKTNVLKSYAIKTATLHKIDTLNAEYSIKITTIEMPAFLQQRLPTHEETVFVTPFYNFTTND